jgi:agmatinase
MPQRRVSEHRTVTDERVRIYGGTPTLYGAPLAQNPKDLQGADVAFLGIPWQAPSPERWLGGVMPNYDTLLSPSTFRQNSLVHQGYLPELDLDVFERLRLVDYGDADVVHDMKQTLANVEMRVKDIIDAGCIPITIGGNAGPSTYPVLKAVAERAGGPTAVLNFDAHHDNQRGEWEDDDPRQPRWGSTWARRILALPGVDPARYHHVGLRGPINDRDTFVRFTERGVKREHIYTSQDLKQARRDGFERWADTLARKIAAGAGKVWIGVDPDVLDIGSNPDFAIDPFGLTADEIIELVHRVGIAAGREKFGGIAFMALPYNARAVHFICLYILLYALAGIVAHTK